MIHYQGGYNSFTGAQKLLECAGLANFGGDSQILICNQGDKKKEPVMVATKLIF